MDGGNVAKPAYFQLTHCYILLNLIASSSTQSTKSLLIDG